MISKNIKTKHKHSIIHTINQTIDNYKAIFIKQPNIIYVGEVDALEIFSIDITIDMAYRYVLIGIDKKLGEAKMYCKKVYKKTYLAEKGRTLVWLLEERPKAIERLNKSIIKLDEDLMKVSWRDKVCRFLGLRGRR